MSLKIVEMKMVLIRSAMLSLFAVQLFAEHSAQEVPSEGETYREIELSALFDEEVPNEEIYEVITRGLGHDDPNIVEATVGAVIFHVNFNRVRVEQGLPLELDRQLQDVPGMYDTLMAMWENGWKQSGRLMPDLVFSVGLQSASMDQTGVRAVFPKPIWTGIPLTLAYLFPGDERVYEIIWEVFPSQYRGGPPDGAKVTYTESELRVEGGSDTNNPLPLLAALFHGKFNTPKAQQFRINILSHIGTIPHFSTLAARSLGDFRSDQGFKALARVLEEDKLIFGTPKISIVEAMLKYGKEAVPYVPLMRKSLENFSGTDLRERDLKTELQARLDQIEKQFGGSRRGDI